MIIFDGVKFAQKMEAEITREVAGLATQGKRIKIGVIAFKEDETGLLYSRLKMEAAGRVGIGFQVVKCSFGDDIDLLRQNISSLNQDPTITGVMIQKPARKVWDAYQQQLGRLTSQVDIDQFAAWWQILVSLIEPNKDVDGLHPSLLDSLRRGTWKADYQVLPATAQAVLTILHEVEKQIVTFSLQSAQVAVIGRSDIVGQPLYYCLKTMGVTADLLGRAQLKELVLAGKKLHAYSVIISATGRQRLITGDMVPTGSVLIDVGEPKADIDQASVKSKASFLTPVPGGVGPMTVACLLKNAVLLLANS